LTGLKERSLADEIIEKCVTIYKQPLGYYRLPLPKPDGVFPGWKIPEQVKTTTGALCDALQDESIMERIQESGIKLFWEREEFRFVVEEQGKQWPAYLDHQKLTLLRNRYPVVPGFDNKTRSDILKEPVVKVEPTSYKDFLKKPKLWKVKNEIIKEGKLHRYGSKFGKTFPILKKTELTTRYRKQE
jgi:hypothetical protein